MKHQGAGLQRDRPLGLFGSGGWTRTSDIWINRLKGVTRYILKAANDETAELFGIIQKPQKAGIVFGKRIGTLQNIGRAARERRVCLLENNPTKSIT